MILSRLLTYKYITVPILVLLATAATALQSARPKSGQIVVNDIEGKRLRPLADGRVRATVLFFIAHDCPVSNSYAPEMARICKTYEKKGIAAYVVYVERDLPSSSARKHARDFRFPCRALLDRDRRLVLFSGAKMTPEAALISQKGDVVYRGRIDDTYIDYGKRRDEPTSRDLRLALDAFLAGKPVSPKRTPVIGCYIPDLPK